MKKQILSLTCLLFATFHTAYAQINSDLSSENLNTTSVYAAKKPLSKSILTKFHEDFPNATNDAWATTARGYLVNFNVTDIYYTVFLNKNGMMTSQIRFYRERHLPKAIRQRVKNLYACYSIRSVKEITSEKISAYLVTIEDNMIWKVVRVVGDDMDILEEHDRN